MHVDDLNYICVLVALMTVAFVLILEAGLLIGIVLPAGSLVLALGVLVGVGVLPMSLAAVTVATATVLGAALGHCLARRRRDSAMPMAGGRLPARIVRLIDLVTTPLAEAVGRRPVQAAATSQFVAGARTLAPRLAVTAGVPLWTMLRGTAPAALVWSGSLVTTGALAAEALPFVRDLLSVVSVPIVLGGAAWLLLRRRSRDAAS